MLYRDVPQPRLPGAEKFALLRGPDPHMSRCTTGPQCALTCQHGCSSSLLLKHQRAEEVHLKEGMGGDTEIHSTKMKVLVENEA